MSVVQSNGSSAVTSTSTNNDGGTVINGGNPASDSPITNNRNMNQMGEVPGLDYGSKVVTNDGTGSATTDPAGAQAVKSGGTGGFAYTVDARAAEGSNRNFLIRGAGGTNAGKINNDTSTLLAVPGSDTAVDGGRDSLHGVIATRQYGSAADVAYDVLAVPSTQRVPGRTKGSNAGNASTFVNPADGTAAVSSEIFPKRDVPGELTYHFGGLAKPTTDEYKAKDSYEDETDTSS
tara:strand:+ start:1037 stop:1738 length:702 start_codon:yes stop_codon:yes gene_type:complete